MSQYFWKFKDLTRVVAAIFQMFTSKEVGQQIGQRLAGSPTSTVSAPSINTSTNVNTSSVNPIADESPIAALSQQSFSASMYEQSVVSSNFDDDRRSLNEGFIMTDEKEGDITRIMSEPAISSSQDCGEYVMLGDVMPSESASDSVMFNDSRIETPRAHCRSFSVDSTLDTSRKGSLKRGQPNSLKAGLLNGDKREVQKLRRSFGLDKSDIGYPIPVCPADMSFEDPYVELDNSMDILCGGQKAAQSSTSAGLQNTEMQESEETSPGSVSRTKSSTSLASVTDKDVTEGDKENGYECDDESEAGFSTISGGTALYVPKSNNCVRPADSGQSKISETVTVDNPVHKTLAQQKQESKDSLLSDTSSTVSPVFHFKEREMTRSISADSGKGSICDEMQDGPNATLDSITSAELDQKESPVKSSEMEPMDVTDLELMTPKAKPDDSSDNVFYDSSDEAPSTVKKAKGSLVQKSVSSQDLKKESEHTPSKVSRSKSLLETSLAQRKSNIKPNLQISAETHKLLARAGYIKDSKPPQPKPEFDFAVPGSFPFIKQDEEAFNPRRESIIALQKNNAGHVRNNVKQFNQITQQNDLVNRKLSPLRFANSTSRRMKFPSAFNKTTKDIDAIRHCIQPTKDKSQVGTAKVPISTHMLKPSDPELSIIEEKPSGTGLKRKPSIYYAEKDGARPPPSKMRNVSRLDTTLEADNEDEVFKSDDEMDASNKNLLDINQSLLDTINEVCTPLSQKVRLNVNSDRVDKKNKENKCDKNGVGKMPDIKPSILTTPVCLETVKLRTGSNKTPVELFKLNKSPRSPIKPLKRLGSSPHSPKTRKMLSPKLVKKTSHSLLSTIPNQSDDLNNL